MRALPANMMLALCLAGPTAASAQPADAGCAELRAIVAAAQTRPPFRSMPQDTPMSALGFQHCEILDMSWDGNTPDFVCIDDFAQSVSKWEQLNADIARCVPGARRYEVPNHHPGQRRLDAHFRAGRAIIVTSEAGYANLPQRYVAIHIEPAPRR